VKLKKIGKKNTNVTPLTEFEPAIPVFEATEYMRNRMRKENCVFVKLYT